tara:strand:- start:107 stop:412 length:306 start_codon:yes stop_codon:yes gene_type:complete
MDIIEILTSAVDPGRSDRKRIEKNTKILARNRKRDIDTLTLVLLSIIKGLIDKEVITHEEIINIIQDLDFSDGKEDGRLSVGKLRKKFKLKGRHPYNFLDE